MKFVFGVAIGYWLFHPYNEKNKLDRVSCEMVRKGMEKVVEFATTRIDKVVGR